MEYTVRFYMNYEYEVVTEDGEQVFKGSLSDCNAWLQLNDKGYFN